MVEPAIFEEDGRLNLVGARHPLLLAALGERTVPIELAAGAAVRTLVVTGPNTGGKTVVLKTAGLFCLMAQSGMHVPGEAGTGMSCFAEVLADIGDEQSIQQSLSTFSGHVRNVVSILGKAGPGALVLLDELGAGTDPSEGAALGVAILEELQRRGAVTIATTHHNAVKIYAATTPGAMNAAMEFDERTLRPTYRLLAGIPGRSQAFAIAENYGLDPAVIARARAQRTIGEERFDRLMEQLEHERAEAARERREAAAASAAIAVERRELEEQAAKQQRSWAERKERLQRETRPALREAERELREHLRLLRETQSAGAADRVKAAAKKLGDLSAEHLAPPSIAAPAPTALAAGERVFVNLLQTWGTVAENAEGQGTATVIVGDKRFTVPLKDLARRGEEAAPAAGIVERKAGKGPLQLRGPGDCDDHPRPARAARRGGARRARALSRCRGAQRHRARLDPARERDGAPCGCGAKGAGRGSPGDRIRLRAARAGRRRHHRSHPFVVTAAEKGPDLRRRPPSAWLHCGGHQPASSSPVRRAPCISPLLSSLSATVTAAEKGPSAASGSAHLPATGISPPRHLLVAFLASGPF